MGAADLAAAHQASDGGHQLVGQLVGLTAGVPADDAVAGMTGGSAPPWAVSQKAADILIAAGMGTGSPTGDWVKVALVTGGALVAAFAVFVASARSRS